MSKENVLDLFHASNEEALDVTLGEILPEVVKQISEMVVSEATASVICEMLGAVFPRINNIRSEERRVGKECRSRWSPYH